MKKKKLSKNRLQSVENSDKKQKKKIIPIIIMGFIVFIMIFSVLAITLFFNDDTAQNQDEVKYNGYIIAYNGNNYAVYVNNVNYPFEYPPIEVENIKSSINLKEEVFTPKAYLLFNPGEFQENSQELARIQNFLFNNGIITNLACSKEEGCGDLPIINCRNPNKVVYIRNADQSSISNEENCIMLDFKEGEQLKVINSFMYRILGVINEK